MKIPLEHVLMTFFNSPAMYLHCKSDICVGLIKGLTSGNLLLLPLLLLLLLCLIQLWMRRGVLVSIY